MVIFTAGDRRPAAMTMGAAQAPDQLGLDPAAPGSIPRMSDLVQNQEQGDTWKAKVLELLTRLVQIQEERAKHQAQVEQQLSLLVNQVSLAQSAQVVQFSSARSN